MNEEKPQTQVNQEPVAVEAQVSKASDFKKNREKTDNVETIKLEGSGLFVRVKRPSIKKLIAQGIIPDNVASFLLNVEKQSDIKPKDLPKLIEMQELITRHTLVEPIVVDEPNYDNGEISLDDLDDGDVNTVWAWFNGGSEAIESFREQREGIAAGLNKQEIPEPKTK